MHIRPSALGCAIIVRSPPGGFEGRLLMIDDNSAVSTEPHRHELCPSDGLLATYIDGAAGESERTQIEEHLARCALCRDVVRVWRTAASPMADESGPAPGDVQSAGRFELLHRLGVGAFGTVYAARDRDIERVVALKLVDIVDGDAEGPLREARALGQVRHTNVVTIHEVARHDGRLVIAMELVEGATLRRWSVGRQWREIATAVVKVARGLAAVHQAGLVHRDVKPDNVVIDVSQRPCLVDFGLASVTSSATTARADGTVESRSIASATRGVGTPAYMAPEQLRGGAATQLSDQFALCVMLFEALYGLRPFGGDSASELLTSIERGQLPRSPSKRRVPRWLDRAVRRGLAFAPNKRWRTISALVSAIDLGLGRRARLRRAGATAVLVAGVGASVFVGRRDATRKCAGAASELSAVWGTTQRDTLARSIGHASPEYATALWATLAKQLDGYAGSWQQAYKEACETSLRGEQSPTTLDLRMTCLHRAKLGLNAAVTKLAAADAGVLERAPEIVGGLPPIEGCEAQYVHGAVVTTFDIATLEPVHRRLAKADAAIHAGQYLRASRLLDQIAELEGVANTGPLELEIQYRAARIAEAQNKIAAPAYKRAFELSLEHQLWREAQRAALGLVRLTTSGELPPATGEAYLEVARALGHKHNRPTIEIELLNAEGRLLQAAGKYKEAEQAHRAALEKMSTSTDPLRIASQYNSLASTLEDQGKLADAAQLYREAISRQVDAFGASHPHVAQVRANLALNLSRRGDAAGAEELFRSAMTAVLQSVARQSGVAASMHLNLGILLLKRGALEEAEQELVKCLLLRRRMFSADETESAKVGLPLATIYAARQQFGKAHSQLRESIRVLSLALGEEHPTTLAAYSLLADVLTDSGRLAEALPQRQRIARVVAKAFGEHHRSIPEERYKLGALLVELGRPREALSPLEQAWRAIKSTDDAERARVADMLARAQWATDNRGQARETMRAAIAAYADQGEPAAASRRAAARWLEQRQ